MKQSKKNTAGNLRSHTAKTKEEKSQYAEKVKFSDAAGETVPIPMGGTSTLSERSVYARTSNAGLVDRDPIKPPQTREPWYASKLNVCGAALAVLVPVVGAVVWLTTLSNSTQFNATRLSELSNSVNELNSRREDLNTRIVKLEQWRDAFSEELKQLRLDIGTGVSERDVEGKLRELEKRILGRVSPSEKSQ